eukprot:CAMPEP_0197282686 /NCGR_PEP_ID=MMETSP1432-20130617/24521_1 /TAXON_ID=44447 /ORGANISM="Pseudo-nitzschia delicatissima, Strain UNC1205" /LENGTH=50 /DNA_ID=CAMNT_0042749659 /DNA_START=117 /DNA_END=266 /DNA_ORIENTATION=-
MSTNNASYTSAEDDSTFENGTNLRVTESLDYSNIGSGNYYTDDGGASSVT